MTTTDDLGNRLLDLADALARHSDDPDRLTRLYLSPAHRAAAEAVRGLMEAAGLEVRLDAVGNVVGRSGAAGRRRPCCSARTSTRWSTPAATTAISAWSPASWRSRKLRGTRTRLPFAIEVLAFGDEEGVALSDAR